MIHLDDIKTFIYKGPENKFEAILPVVTTLISGLVIILSISPAYLRELNPFTLLLLSIAASLPVWALNQLLWWHLGRKVSSQLVTRIVMTSGVVGKKKKMISFALVQLMKVLDVVHAIPSKKLADLVTISTIYLSAAAVYFTSGSPSTLYGYIFALSLIVWLVALFILHRVCRKIDLEPLKMAWRQLTTNDALIDRVNRFFEKIEKIFESSVHLYRGSRDGGIIGPADSPEGSPENSPEGPSQPTE